MEEEDTFYRLQIIANRESGIDREMKKPSFENLLEILDELQNNQTKRYCEYCGKRLKKRSGPLWHMSCLTEFNNNPGSYIKFDPITGEMESNM